MGSPLHLLLRSSNGLDAQRVIPPAYFGMHIGNLSPINVFQDYTSDALPYPAGSYRQTPWPAIPIGLMRQWDTSGTTWREIMRADGSEFWANMDFFFDQCEAHNVEEVIMTLGSPPDHVTAPNYGQPTTDTIGFPPLPIGNHVGYNPFPPVNLSDWAAWCAKFATRYAVRALKIWYEPWNEVNDGSHGPGVAGVGYVGTLSQLLDLARIMREVIAPIDPSAGFLTPNFTGGGLSSGQSTVSLDAWLAAGGAAYADTIMVHGYSSFAPRFSPELILDHGRAVRAIMAKRGVSKPVWNDEWGLSTYIADDGSPKDCDAGGDPPMPAARAAGVLVRAVLCNWLAGYDRYVHFQLDWRASAIRMVDHDSPGTLLAPATAWDFCANLLASGTLFGLVRDGHVYSARFTTADRRRGIIYWMDDYRLWRPGAASASVPTPTGAASLRNLWGESQTLGASITVTGNPVYLFLED